MISQEITEIFNQLPGCTDDLFDALWHKGKLYYESEGNLNKDETDLFNAQLICATVALRERLLIVLPDFASHRAAMLFSTALLRCWQNLPLTPSLERPSFLYFGTSVGIREQLKSIKIRDFKLKLTDVFEQTNLSRRNQCATTSQGSNANSQTRLPKVITIYSPADPLTELQRYDPQCIAIDLTDSTRAEWLKHLLSEAQIREIPVVAWGQNALSECVSVFRELGMIVNWSPRVTTVNPNSLTQIQPLIVESAEANQLDDIFREAAQLLLAAMHIHCGQLGQSALRQHWYFLRNLESLCVPFDFYEIESGNFWGLQSFAQMSRNCEYFRNACSTVYPQLTQLLEKTASACGRAIEILSQLGSPLWNAINSLCLTESPPLNSSRLLTFSGKSRKNLFLLAMLACHNFSENDLLEIGVRVTTLAELSLEVKSEFSSINDAPKRSPLLVGLPSKQITPKLLPIFWHDSLDVLIYPHQVVSLQNRITEIEQAVNFNYKEFEQTLKKLSRQEIPKNESSHQSRLKLTSPQIVDAQTAERRQPTTLREKLWQIGNPLSEIERILQIDDDDQADDVLPFQELREGGSVVGDEVEVWCNSAVQVSFDTGDLVIYPSDEQINVIKTSSAGIEVQERFVRSLRPGDRVVLIHNQRRQSFYQLLISRLHGHPAMALHLNLIQRWQTDFLSSYRGWALRKTQNLDALLRLLQERGSRLTSNQTLRLWLQGKVMCPDDNEDLRRLAEILGMDFVRQNYKLIGLAARRLSGLHRGLANKLNRWLTAQAAGNDSRLDDCLIDSELNLTFGDLRSSLLLLQVTEVQTLSGLWVRSELGRFENRKGV